MALSPGSRLGPYEILSAIGAGGMGEVYRARDTRLHRDVALKILPEAVAHDADRRARFQREAHLLAAVNHPNIAQVHGIEETPDVMAIAMELVSGETLADRIGRGPMAPADALPVAVQIARALDHAHESGIVHRDLKPTNIKVRDDGTVKVLDFGLAKALAPSDASAAGDAANSPTLTSPAMTRAGVILGTAAYMAPEQARGRPVDKRADVWAFGCVLYEMLTGRPPFDGEDMAAVLGAVVRLEPDWTALPPGVPSSVRWLLARCLQKDPQRRLRDIGDARSVIEDPSLAEVSAEADAAPAPRARISGLINWAGWAVAAAAVSLATWSVSRSPGQGVADPLETRLQILIPATDAELAISPDGRSLAYGGVRNGRWMLWIRDFGSEEARPIEGTTDGGYPVWSPDGRSLAFYADGFLKRLDLAAGAIRSLAPVTTGRRPAWSTDGTILFGSNVGPLFRVSADGGAVRPITTLASGQTNHRMPQFLPDGRRFLYYALGTIESRGLYLGSLDAPSIRRIADRDDAFTLLPPSHMIVAKDGALWARRFNMDTVTFGGELIPVAPRVLTSGDYPGRAALTTSATGSIAYIPRFNTSRLEWFGRDGRLISSLGEPEAQALSSLTSDGRHVAVDRATSGNRNVWILDGERGTARRLTFDPAGGSGAVFSRDGRLVAYSSDEKADVYDVFVRPADGTGRDELLLHTGQNVFAQDWSPNGKHLLVTSQTPTAGLDVAALPLDTRGALLPVATTKYDEDNARFSPDGHWVSFTSNETGRFEVFVQRFPQGGPKTQVSMGGGSGASWRSDGRELLYTGTENRVMAVDVRADGEAFTTGAPRVLFTLPDHSAGWAVTADGQRFLIQRQSTDPALVTVITNWKPPR